MKTDVITFNDLFYQNVQYQVRISSENTYGRSKTSGKGCGKTYKTPLKSTSNI